MKNALKQSGHPTLKFVNRTVIPGKRNAVRTTRLGEHFFEHDFSDFSDPERRISRSRWLSRSTEDDEITEEILQVFSRSFLIILVSS